MNIRIIVWCAVVLSAVTFSPVILQIHAISEAFLGMPAVLLWGFAASLLFLVLVILLARALPDNFGDEA